MHFCVCACVGANLLDTNGSLAGSPKSVTDVNATSARAAATEKPISTPSPPPSLLLVVEGEPCCVWTVAEGGSSDESGSTAGATRTIWHRRQGLKANPGTSGQAEQPCRKHQERVLSGSTRTHTSRTRVRMTTNTLLEAVEEIYSRQQVQIFSMFERVYVNVCAAQRKAHSGPRAHRCTLKPLIGPAARATVSSAVRLLAGLLL